MNGVASVYGLRGMICQEKVGVLPGYQGRVGRVICVYGRVYGV